MATVNYVNTTTGRDINALTVRWTLTTADSDGLPYRANLYRDRSVMVIGTFGSGTVALQGSNDKVNWFNLTIPGGAACTFTAAGLKAVTEYCAWVRPVITGSTAATVDIYLAAGGNYV